jgi:hypothetical protein
MADGGLELVDEGEILDGSFYSRNCFLGEFLDFSTELLSFVNF